MKRLVDLIGYAAPFAPFAKFAVMKTLLAILGFVAPFVLLAWGALELAAWVMWPLELAAYP